MKKTFMKKNTVGFYLIAACYSSLSASVYAADEQFNDALRAANSGDIYALDQYQQSMKNDVLGYYPEYWKMNRNLASQPASNIVAFAQHYPQSAMAEKLAADYVEEKVKQGDFLGAQPVLSYVTNADAAENCAVAQVRARTGDALVFAEFKDVWLTTDTQPESCHGLAKLMLNSPIMNFQDKQQRLWSMLRAGQTSYALAVAQNMGLDLSVAQLSQIQTDPINYLWSAPKNNPLDYAYLIYAMGRLADSDLAAAIANVPRASIGVPPDVQKYLYRSVAYIGGTTVMKNGFNREVLNYFDASYGYPFSPEEAEIYARQAIRFSNWEAVIRAIDNMTPTQKVEDRWQYWLARAAEQRGDVHSKQQAQKIYEKLAQGDGYHNLLAKDRLGQSYAFINQNKEPSHDDQARLSQNIHFNRAFALKRINAPDSYINREWNWAVRQAYLKDDDGLLIAAAQKASDMGWLDRAIYAAERTVKQANYRLRYAMPYKDYVVQHSQYASIDPAWAYGIMRQESRFVPNAKSPVGAGGLMQVMPSTARLVARRLGDVYSPTTLTDPYTNIRYGTFYLAMSQAELSSNAVLATAGYNAGPNRARRWQPDIQDLPADQYTESIPLFETRDYVKHVMTNATYYGYKLGESQNLTQRLQSIPVKNEP